VGSSGYITFIAGGQRKNAYCHDDSGPAHLGLRVLNWLRDSNPADVTAGIERLQLVTEDDPPTEDQLRRLQEWSGTERTGWPEDQWYRLLRGAQGDPAAILAVGYAVDDRLDDDDDYPPNTQWSYTIDADNRMLAVGNPVPGAEWPWDDLPDETNFLAACARLIP
jgi:hypothetical protein